MQLGFVEHSKFFSLFDEALPMPSWTMVLCHHLPPPPFCRTSLLQPNVPVHCSPVREYTSCSAMTFKTEVVSSFDETPHKTWVTMNNRWFSSDIWLFAFLLTFAYQGVSSNIPRRYPMKSLFKRPASRSFPVRSLFDFVGNRQNHCCFRRIGGL